MPFIAKFVKPAPSLDYQTTIYDAMEYLVLEQHEYALVKREGEIVGIINTDHLLKLRDIDLSRATIFSIMEPAFFVDASEQSLIAGKVMKENDVEHIAVVDDKNNVLGIISGKDIQY